MKRTKLYRKAAEQGDAAAQNNLGFMYINGEGVPQDYQEALKWYSLAAEQGHADANTISVSCTTTVRAYPRTTKRP